MILLAIDPGHEESAYTFVDEACRPLAIGKVPNAELLAILEGARPGFLRGTTDVRIEMVASYGMPVGAEVFETCVWIGRFRQALVDWRGLESPSVYRTQVKNHLCHVSNARDSNVTQALIDRFAMGKPNRGKGTKADPGWFYGFAKDIWQAYAVAVYAVDQL